MKTENFNDFVQVLNLGQALERLKLALSNPLPCALVQGDKERSFEWLVA